MPARILRLILPVALVAALAAFNAPRAPREAEAVPVGRTVGIDPTKGIRNLDHLIFIVQENRSFDHYFGTFPGANGIPRKPDGSFKPCIPDPEAGICRKPFHDPGLFDAGGAHSERASHMDVNGGKMDGFIRAQQELYSICGSKPDLYQCRRAAREADDRPDVMGFHTAKEIPNYWAYAKRYLLQDRMFAPSDSWTLPAHLYLVSAWSALCSDLSGPDPDASSCRTSLTRPDQDWRPQDGAPRPYRWADITWLLHQHGVSWAYYVGPGTCVRAPCAKTDEPATAPVINVLPGFRTVEETNQFGRIRPYDDFFSRAAAGTLPAVSWVTPVGGKGEHPPDYAGYGQAWVTKVVNAIMRGPRAQWLHTAIFVVWDDWGGFYDHVPPIEIDPYGYGIRVPAFVISPWVTRGLNVDHQTVSFDAYLKLIEDRFLGGQRLDGENMGWPDPRPSVREELVRGDLRRIFDFTQVPIPRVVLDPVPG